MAAVLMVMTAIGDAVEGGDFDDEDDTGDSDGDNRPRVEVLMDIVKGLSEA